MFADVAPQLKFVLSATNTREASDDERAITISMHCSRRKSKNIVTRHYLHRISNLL